MRNNYFVVFTFLLLACNANKKDKSSQLVGTWQNLDLRVEMNSYQGTEGDSLLIVKANQWEELLKIRPIITEFKADGSYTSDYINPNDSLVFQSTGTWHINGDSLVMIEYDIPNSYLVKFEGNQARFSGNLDWDEDGVKDDAYTGIQIRLE